MITCRCDRISKLMLDWKKKCFDLSYMLAIFLSYFADITDTLIHMGNPELLICVIQDILKVVGKGRTKTSWETRYMNQSIAFGQEPYTSGAVDDS